MSLIVAFEWAFGALFAGLAGLVLLRILTGDIVLTGLLAGTAGSAALEPERLQAFAIAVGIPLLYTAQVFQAIHEGQPLERLPDVPEWMLVLAAGSQTLYLSGKIARSSSQPT